MTKQTKGPVRLAKTQISLRSRLESSLCTLSVAKDLMLLHAHNKDSDQTGRMPRLICVFAGAQMSFCWFYHAAAHMF